MLNEFLIIHGRKLIKTHFVCIERIGVVLDHFGFVLQKYLHSVVVLEITHIIYFVKGFPLLEFRDFRGSFSMENECSNC